MQEVRLTPLDPERFRAVVPEACMEEFVAQLSAASSTLRDRVLWHVNSTATGGGVAEMLQSVLCYLLGAGIDTRWATVDGDDDFFVVTKRIHHMLHGEAGDGGRLGRLEQAQYRASLDRELEEVLAAVSPGDVVLLHDPQTVGLAAPLQAAGARVVWICHVGADEHADHEDRKEHRRTARAHRRRSTARRRPRTASPYPPSASANERNR